MTERTYSPLISGGILFHLLRRDGTPCKRMKASKLRGRSDITMRARQKIRLSRQKTLVFPGKIYSPAAGLYRLHIQTIRSDCRTVWSDCKTIEYSGKFWEKVGRKKRFVARNGRENRMHSFERQRKTSAFLRP